MQEFNFIDVLAQSCANYRTTGAYISETQATEAAYTGKTIYSSKQLLLYHFYPNLVPEDFETIVVTNDDISHATTIIKYFRRLTFRAISNNISDFHSIILSYIDVEKVTGKAFAMIACMPMAYKRDYDINTKSKVIMQTEGKVLEPIGDQIQTYCYILDVKYVTSVKFSDFYAYTAITTDGFLIEFTNKKKVAENGQSLQIKGKIRDHSVDYNTKKPLTRINYVKILN